MRHFLLRGILIGGSMGVLYALAGFSDSLPRAFGVGMIGGALAGLTLAIRQRKRQGPEMTPATDGANAPPGNSRFEAIASSTLTGRFFGVPFFRPSVSPALLFNVWAYLLGPFAFFLFGLWRKGIVLLAVGLFLYAPLILPTDASAFTDILIEAYTPYYQALQALALLFVLLFCLGRGFWALLAFLTFAAVFLYGSFHTERLYIGLGFGTAYAWLNMSIIWKALFQAGLFSLLGRCWLGFAAILIDGLALWYVGLPLNLPVSVLPRRGLSRLLRHDGHL